MAIGRVHLVDRRKVKHPKHHVADDAVDGELVRLQQGIDDARASLTAIKERAPDHSAILEAHLLMMADPLLVEGARRHIVDDKKCAEWALRVTVQDIRKTFDSLGDAYFRERRSDIDFVGDRILSAMMHADAQPLLDDISDDAVIVAHDLSPADAIALSKRRVRGLVTEAGGATSHTAILARALEIPAVVACAAILEFAGNGDAIIVDGDDGEVVFEPSPDVIARYTAMAERRARVTAELQRDALLPSVTPDGQAIALLANIEIPDEVNGALAHGAQGVGLYRSEFLYMNRGDPPSEDEHLVAYRSILRDLGGRPATLRTFDLGSDKLASSLRVSREANPALGVRGVRLGFAKPQAFRAQLRGMIRAFGEREGGKIMLPMIGSVDQVVAVRALIDEEAKDLAAAGHAVPARIDVGVMIELPAAVFIADELAAVSDFFSVGTNDLIQYLLAIDRGNEHVSHLYEPLHPAVLRALKLTVDAAKRRGIPVSLCGEMAADPLLTPLLLGLGFDSLSMPTLSIPRVKWLVRRFAGATARALVDRALACRSGREVTALVEETLKQTTPDVWQMR